MRDRTISWMENQILKELSKQSKITTYLAMSYLTLDGVRSLQEQHNLDIALVNLLSRKVVKKSEDDDGHTVYQIAA